MLFSDFLLIDFGCALGLSLLMIVFVNEAEFDCMWFGWLWIGPVMLQVLIRVMFELLIWFDWVVVVGRRQCWIL